jgi:hypothetical protein
MKTLRKLIFLALFFFLTGYSGGIVYGQLYCITEDVQGSCVGGQCYCWSVTTTCGPYSCSASGGACPASGGVSIIWSNPTTCNFGNVE